MSVCPRTGQPCPHAKVFGVTEVTPQGVVEMQCCQKCAMAMPTMVALPSLPTPMSVLQQLLGGVLTFPSAQPQPPSAGVELSKCAGCGMTTADMERAGRFGCGNCYSSFGKEIDTMLRRIHGSVTHEGKVPHAWKSRQASEQPVEASTAVDRGVATVKKHAAIPMGDRIDLLEAKMKKYVEKEEYEKAAIVRDVIKQFKTSSVPASSGPTPPSVQLPSGTPSVSPEDHGPVSEVP